MMLQDVLRKPLVTEKSNALRELGLRQYVFVVNPRANKPLVKEAVETLFKVEVLKVSILVQKPKTKVSRRGHRGVGKHIKKAFVQLKEGSKISELEV